MRIGRDKDNPEPFKSLHLEEDFNGDTKAYREWYSKEYKRVLEDKKAKM
jgi:hypothetical protein